MGSPGVPRGPGGFGEITRTLQDAAFRCTAVACASGSRSSTTRQRCIGWCDAPGGLGEGSQRNARGLLRFFAMGTPGRTRERLIDAALWALTLLCAGLTLSWSFGPSAPGADAFPGADRVGHGIAFFATSLSFLLAAVWRPGRGRGPLHAWRWALVAALIVLGGLVEIGQSAFTETREAEFWDWFCELIAIFLAAGIVAALEGHASANTQIDDVPTLPSPGIRRG